MSTISKLVFILSLFSLTAVASDINVVVKSVYDGDTFRSEFSCLPPSLKNVSIRIMGIDTPEIRGKCDQEKLLALQAKTKLEDILKGHSSVLVKDAAWDKYGGRIDGKVFLLDGADVAEEMIKSGLARPYFGGFRKNWCN